jgi:hypothetical protein
MNTSRRSFMGLFATAPLAFVAGKAGAFELADASKLSNGYNTQPAGGLWTTLIRATDGTDPSTAITTELPRFTPEIRKLANTAIELEGYLQPVGAGFGKAEYIISQTPYHCTFCYPQGRAALALVQTTKPLPQIATTKKIKVRGTLVLQETVPDDFYYQIQNATLV